MDINGKIGSAMAVAVILQLSILGFVMWVVVKVMQHFGII